MPADCDSLRLDGWTPDELRETLRNSSGAGSDQGIDEAIRFVRGVAYLVRRREAVDKDVTDPSDLSVFLLAPRPPNDGGFERDPLLRQGHTSLAGKIWCVNAPVITGWGMDLDAATDDDIFRMVTQELKLGDCPAIIVDPRLELTEVYYYPNGLAVPDHCVQIRLHTSNIDIVQLSDVIDRVYQSHLKTPDAQPHANKLWRESRRYRPHRLAEHRIQALLLPAFSVAWPSCRVWDEFAGTMGRADIHIAEHDPLDYSRLTHLAVLELKVLRSVSEGGGTSYSDRDSQTWVEDGIRQAGAYREEHGHQVAALCCFDMRREDTGEECFAALRTLANTKMVALRRWYLFATSKQARDT